jgi:ubiquinone/menaquinone biosynthesis C-methylase UbiE
MPATPEESQRQQELADFYRDAADYDLEYADFTPYDLPFWQQLVTERPARRVVELGCGSGRLTIPLARLGAERGFCIVGIDRTESMLARAQEKRAAESPAVQAVLSFHQGDMRAWQLDAAPFDLMIAPFNAVMHLHSLDDQLAAWRCAYAQLVPGGRFVVDIFMPVIKQLIDGVYHPPVDGHRAPDGARLAAESETRHYDAISQTQRLQRTTRYTFDDPARPDRQTSFGIDIHMYFPRELQLLFLHTGFEIVAAYGDYHRRPLGPGATRQILVGQRPAMDRREG